MNGQDDKKKKKSIASNWLMSSAEEDSISHAQSLAAVSAEDDSLRNSQLPHVDKALKGIYGPVSQYVSPDSLYKDYSNIYNSLNTLSGRNLTGFDPIDYATKKGLGTSYQRETAVRGGRYGHFPMYSTSPVYGKGKGIPGFSEWKKKGRPEIEDYFYDLAFQQNLDSIVSLGAQSQGVRKGPRSTNRLLSKLKQLTGDSFEDYMDDIIDSSMKQADSWILDYQKDTKGKMGEAILAVDKRKFSNEAQSTLTELNAVLKRKESLDKTKESLDKIDSTHTTNVASKIIDEQTSKVDSLENNVISKADSTIGDTLYWDDFFKSYGRKKKDKKKKKQPWLPEGVKDTGLKNYSGNRIRMHEDLIPIYMEALDTLQKEGINLQIEDSFRYKGVQKEQYDSSFGTAKEGLVAHPDSSYHVRGRAFDLAQTKEMRDNPRIAEVLSSLGLIQSRPDDEWWHWSTPN
jgi:hypothetical protein